MSSINSRVPPLRLMAGNLNGLMNHRVVPLVVLTMKFNSTIAVLLVVMLDL